jgi:hypothetical protein
MKHEGGGFESLLRLPRALRPLAHGAVITEGRASPLRPSREPSPTGRAVAALTGRATPCAT